MSELYTLKTWARLGGWRHQKLLPDKRDKQIIALQAQAGKYREALERIEEMPAEDACWLAQEALKEKND